MEITDLKQMTKEEVFNFIRQRLSFSKELQEQFRHVNKSRKRTSQIRNVRK